MKRFTQFSTVAFLLVFSFSSFAGVVLGSTRVIFNEDQPDATLTLTNTRDDKSYLVQSWVGTNGPAGEKAPFIVTPPLFRLGHGQKNILRIVNVNDDLPGDRESLYWLNIKPVPANDHESANELQVIIKSSVKLFYRPASVRSAAADAYKKLNFIRKDEGVEIVNPTPVYVSLYKLTFSDKDIKDVSMLPPFSHTFVRSTQRIGQIQWQAVNDSGALTSMMHYVF